MGLDRGIVAKLDRELLAGLGRDEAYRMVRVPVAAATWATWKRYCESVGISMGRAIVALIERELLSALRDDLGDDTPLFAERAAQELAMRQEQVARREQKAAAVEERLRQWEGRLRRWEGEVEARERRVEFATKNAGPARSAESKIGRNQRCPCGSGLKYKHCHGTPGR